MLTHTPTWKVVLQGGCFIGQQLRYTCKIKAPTSMDALVAADQMIQHAHPYWRTDRCWVEMEIL